MTQDVARPGTLIDLRLDPHRWGIVEALVSRMAETDAATAVAVQICRNGHRLPRPLTCGRQRLEEPTSDTLRDDAIFLVASITKLIVATAVMRLVEQGELALNDRVVDLIPEFDAAPRRPMTVRHLLTHTSGLPDMLPNNRQLREANRPLTAFLEGTCAVTLDFPPGHGTQYQSMGFVLLAEIIHRVSGRSCQQYVADEVFAPLDMSSTHLGLPDDWFAGAAQPLQRLVEVRVPPDHETGVHWNWNSRYWRQLGAPWGGLFASADDIARFCIEMAGADCVLSPATIEQMTSNQLLGFANVPEVDRRTRPWGLGWRLNWQSHPASFSDLLGPDVFGHWGATGTLCWIDRQSRTCCVILTSQPLDRGRNHLVRLSNAIASACR